MESDLVMWWNFVGSSHEEVVEARRAWQAEMGAEADSTGGDEAAGATPPTDGDARGARFGTVLGYDGSPLKAPPMPHGRLRARKASR
jgi:hypothetical protein